MNALLTTLYLDNTRIEGLLFSTPSRCERVAEDRKCIRFHEEMANGQELYKFKQCPYGYASCQIKVYKRTAFICGLNIKGISPKKKVIETGMYIPAITESRAVALAKKNVEFLESVSDAQRQQKFIPTIVHGLTKILDRMRSNGEFLMQKCTDTLDEETREKLATIAISTIAATTFFYSDRMQALNAAIGSPRSIDVYGKFYKMKKIIQSCRSRSSMIEMSGLVQYKYGLFVSFEIAVYQLLENAVKYSPKCRVINVNFDEDATGLHIQIKNVGPYVARKELKKITEFRVRGENAGKYTEEGSGIGLASVSNIAEVNGFVFHIDSSSRIEEVIDGIKFSKFCVRLELPISLRREQKEA